MSTHPLTPMLLQYQQLKHQHPGTLLFFRLGDFYELFFDDALVGSRELQITLTARHKERGSPVPMCGVPHHSAANYIAKLVRKGYRVAICEQTEEPTKTKKLVRREVVRIVTPGTPIDPQLLETREPVFLAAICSAGETVGAAFLDISTGEFRATQTQGHDAWAKILADLESYSPRELLYPASLGPLIKSGITGRTQTTPLPLTSADPDQGQISDQFPGPSSGSSQTVTANLTSIEDWLWQRDDCAELLRKHFDVHSLAGYGLERKDEALRAAGACLRYARETQRGVAPHVTDLTYFETQDHLVLDSVTVRNLELVDSLAGGPGRSLLDVIDQTVTGMGARLLRSWLLRPSIKRGEVESRLSAVAELVSSQINRDNLRSRLKNVSDLERLTGRINLGSATPRDLNAMLRSLDQVPAIRRLLSEQRSSLLQVLYESSDELPEVRELVTRAINDDPPAKLSEGNTIRSGYSAELDEIRSIIFSSLHYGKEWVTHEWLSEVLIYLLYRNLGYGGLIIVFALIVTGAFLVTYRRYCQTANHPYIAGFALLLGAFSTLPTWGVRPQMFTLLLASIFLAILDGFVRGAPGPTHFSLSFGSPQKAFRERGDKLKYVGHLLGLTGIKNKGLYWLVPLTVLWVNLHAGFALGLGLILLTIVGLVLEEWLILGQSPGIVWRRVRPLVIVWVVCLFSVVLNPNGIRIYSYPFETVKSEAMMKYINEWWSPDFHQLMFQPLALLIFTTFGALALARKHVSIKDLLLLAVTGLAALRSARNVPFFALVAIPVLAEHSWAWLSHQRWGQWLNRPELSEAGNRATLKIVLNIGLLVLAPIGLAVTRVAHTGTNQASLNSTQFPAAAVDFMLSQKLPQPVYNEYGWGGYLIWRAFPDYRVYIDGRADVYGDAFLEEFLMTHGGEIGWEEPLNKHGVGTALVRPNTPIASLLRQAPGWQKTFEDPQAVIFTRKLE